ncbi:hypothetical protein Bca101_096955 [Brassica carinata]
MDRALVNSKCSKIFLDSFAIFERSGIYDHAKYVIQIKTVEIPEAETFLVFNYLIKHPQLHESITSYYTETESLFHARSEIHRFHKKLKGLKTLLRAMNRERYGDITRRTQVSLDVLRERQRQVLLNPYAATFEMRQQLHESGIIMQK